MRDDARAEADAQHRSCGAGDGRALAPRSLLRCRLERRDASCHGLVTGMVIDRSPRDRLQGRASRRIAGLLLGDGRHPRRFRLRHVRGQDLGLLRGLRLRLGQDRGALGVTCRVLVVVRHGDAPFC